MRLQFNPSVLSSPSGILLLLVNFVPLLGVLVWDWSVYAILLLYWSENVAIGVLNLLRMAIAPTENMGGHFEKLFMLPFFTVHYGMFTAGHGVFVRGFFGEDTQNSGLFTIYPELLGTIIEQGLLIAALALAASHVFSLVVNYIGKQEYRHTSARELMMRPYGRVVVLHITIIAGGALIHALDEPIALLLVLVALKTGMDLFSHGRERSKLAE